GSLITYADIKAAISVPQRGHRQGVSLGFGTRQTGSRRSPDRGVRSPRLAGGPEQHAAGSLRTCSHMRITDILRSIDLFARLSADDLDHLARRIHDRAVGADAVVRRQADPAEPTVIPTSSRSALSTPATDGRE